MQPLRTWALRHWPRHREKVLYLIVGGWNTLFWYACFAVLYYLLSERLAPSLIVVLAYLIATMNGYLTFRYIVFKPVRNVVVEYVRFQAVYLPILVLNVVALPLALSMNLSAYIVQPLCSAFAFVAAYFGNKYFAFRRRKATH